jgi:hypothetical protein
MSDEHTASIFRVEEEVKQVTRKKASSEQKVVTTVTASNST